jgi:hypothetical protein
MSVKLGAEPFPKTHCDAIKMFLKKKPIAKAKMIAVVGFMSLSPNTYRVRGNATVLYTLLHDGKLTATYRVVCSVVTQQ